MMTSQSHTSAISPQEMREALARVVYEAIYPVSVGLCLLYILFANAHSLVLPRPIATQMVIVASGSAIFFAGLALLAKRSLITVSHAQLVAGLIAQVVLWNSFLHLYLSGEIYQTTNILLVIVGIACFSLSPLCFVFTVSTGFIGWELILWTYPHSPERLHFIFAMGAATVLALLIFFVRLNMHQRFERLRVQDVRQKAELERALIAAKEVERLKDDLISTVSHELRTPLTSLVGFTELMLERDFPLQKRQELLAIVHGESLRLTKLINNFLDLQAMENGHAQYHFVAASLAQVLQEAVAVFSRADGKHTWRLTIPDSLPLVHMDAGRIHQVLANFLSNAMKFSQEGGEISVGVQVQAPVIQVWVADQGIGIPPEVQPQLFNKFFRVNDDSTRAVNGTGLGLALVKEIVEAHHGRVWVDSTLGKGSTFFFTLPLAT